MFYEVFSPSFHVWILFILFISSVIVKTLVNFFFETESCYIVHFDFNFDIFLPQPLKCQNYRYITQGILHLPGHV